MGSCTDHFRASHHAVFHPIRGRKTAATLSPAFSLVELLAVIGIIALLGSILLVSIAGFSSGIARRGAVNLIMNTFEQARVAALESGTSVDVLLWRRSFPEKDALLVLRERTESDSPPAGSTGASSHVFLTGWTSLPRGVILRELNNTITAAGIGTTDASKLPGAPAADDLSLVRFNYLGIVESPTANLQLFLSEGVRDANGTEAAIPASRKSGNAAYLEKITLARFTGRARLEVSTVR